jgi:hypothetical protein
MKTSLGSWLWLILASVGFLGACSSHKPPPPTTCSTENPCQTPLVCADDGVCRQSCTLTADCAEGTICATQTTQNVCATPCQGKEDCADNEECGSDGICRLACIDNDHDGYGPNCAKGPDCDDNDATINPGADEIPLDQKDNNCNGLVDEAEWDQYPKCYDKTQTATRKAPNMMLVLDFSGSMRDTWASTTKVGALRTAIRGSSWPTPKGGLLGLNNNGTVIRFGLETYPKNSTCGIASSRSDIIPIDDVNANTSATDTAIATAISATPGNSTPTGPALSFVDNSSICPELFDNNFDNYVVLATDGMPNCPNHGGNGPDPAILDKVNNHLPANNNYTGDPAYGWSDANPDPDLADFKLAYDAVVSLKSHNIYTFVIGVGPSVSDSTNSSPRFLNDLARVGAPPGGSGTYYPADSPDALTAAFQNIGRSVIKCELVADDRDSDFETYVDHMWLVYTNDAGVKVAMNRSDTDGFEYVGNYTFQVYGQSCTDLSSGAITDLEIIMGCAPPK